MRIGIYGLPCAGKTSLIQQVTGIRHFSGSELLHRMEPRFDTLTPEEKCEVRASLAIQLRHEEIDFIIDGHYSFGDDVVFTEFDGMLYDAILYLYVSPDILRARMQASEKNRKYASLDIAAWQAAEIKGLRDSCHRHYKDFYVLDDPENGCFMDNTLPLAFIQDIIGGYSCMRYAGACASRILTSSTDTNITLCDGDRTLILEDSSYAAFGYRTHLFDGNFYTGFQSWRQARDFTQMSLSGRPMPDVHRNEKVFDLLFGATYIVTAGHPAVWEALASSFGLPVFSGPQMSADTKFFITRFLQSVGKRVAAFGDSMGDYYMLKRADEGILVRRPDGSLSRSLSGCDLEGLSCV